MIAQTVDVGSLSQWGIAGAILAVFVAPVFYVMIKSFQRREERDGNVTDALIMSVDQQKAALEQWRNFELNEEKVHAAIMANLGQVAQNLSIIADRMQAHAENADANLETHSRVAQVLDEIATKLKATS